MGPGKPWLATCVHVMACTSTWSGATSLRAHTASSQQLGMQELATGQTECLRSVAGRIHFVHTYRHVCVHLYIRIHILTSGPPSCSARKGRRMRLSVLSVSNLCGLPCMYVNIMCICVPCVHVQAENTSSALLLVGTGDMEQQQPPRLPQAVRFHMIYFPLIN